MAYKDDMFYFRRGIELSYEAIARGNDGFASLLAGPEGDILLERTNTARDDNDITAHDAINLARAAAQQYPPEFLNRCTVYATLEPCIMCMGAIYWTGIGNVKYAVSEQEYCDMRGGGLDIHSSEFARRSPRKINVTACDAAHDEVMEVIKAHIAAKTKGSAS